MQSMKFVFLALAFFTLLNVASATNNANALYFNGTNVNTWGVISTCFHPTDTACDVNGIYGTYTFALWFKRDVTGANANRQALMTYGSGPDKGLELYIINNKVRFQYKIVYGAGQGAVWYLETATISDYNWHHVAGVYTNATNVRTLYLDGVAVASDVGLFNYNVTANKYGTPGLQKVALGGTINGLIPLYGYGGYIARAMLFGRALAAFEITNLFSYDAGLTAGVVDYPGYVDKTNLLLYLKLDQPTSTPQVCSTTWPTTGSTITDDSGNAAAGGLTFFITTGYPCTPKFVSISSTPLPLTTPNINGIGFTGPTQYARTTNNIDISTQVSTAKQFTITAWTKLSRTPNIENVIWSHGDPSSNFYLALRPGQSRVYLGFNYAEYVDGHVETYCAQDMNCAPEEAGELDSWHMWAVVPVYGTYGPVYAIFIDGAPIGVLNYCYGLYGDGCNPASAGPLYIGNLLGSGSNSYFNGQIARVNVYSRTLAAQVINVPNPGNSYSPNEVRDLYYGIYSVSTTGLVGSWSLQSNLLDTSGNNNHIKADHLGAWVPNTRFICSNVQTGRALFGANPDPVLFYDRYLGLKDGLTNVYPFTAKAPLSISLYWRPYSAAGGWLNIRCSMHNPNPHPDDYFQYTITAGASTHTTYDGWNTDQYTSNAAMGYGWNHILWTIDGNARNNRVYVNGTKIIDYDATTTTMPSIMTVFSCDVKYQLGEIAKVYLYNQTLLTNDYNGCHILPRPW